MAKGITDICRLSIEELKDLRGKCLESFDFKAAIIISDELKTRQGFIDPSHLRDKFCALCLNRGTCTIKNCDGALRLALCDRLQTYSKTLIK